MAIFNQRRTKKDLSFPTRYLEKRVGRVDVVTELLSELGEDGVLEGLLRGRLGVPLLHPFLPSRHFHVHLGQVGVNLLLTVKKKAIEKLFLDSWIPSFFLVPSTVWTIESSKLPTHREVTAWKKRV